MIATLLSAGLLACPVPDVPAPPKQDGRLAIRGAHVIAADGSVLENAVVLVENGRIVSVGGEAPEDVALVEHDGWVSAGLVACRTFNGAGSTSDTTRHYLPEARIADAFDPTDGTLDDLLEAGITTVVLTPGTTTVCGGQTAVAKTDGTVVSRSGHLSISLLAGTLGNVYTLPTSTSQVLLDLAEHLGSGKGAFGKAADGTLPVYVHAGSRAEVQRACGLAQAHGLGGAIVGGSLAGEMAATVKASGLSVVLGPFTSTVSHRTLAAAAKLAEAGVPIGFGLNGPAMAPDELRLTAARCVRAGMDPGVALAGLTSTGAGIAGAGDRVGSLAPGKDADLVLWSGHPLDLSSSVAAVYVGGELAHHAAHGGDE